MGDGVFRGLTIEEFEAKMRERGMTVDGKEIPDSVPFKPAVKVARQLSMFDVHRARVAQERLLQGLDGDETADEMVDMGSDDDLVERLSEYEQADLDIVLAQIEARRKSSESEPKPPAPSQDEPADRPAVDPAPEAK